MTALLDVVAFKGMDPAELDRIETRCRALEPRDGARILRKAIRPTPSMPLLEAPGMFASAHSIEAARGL